MSTEQIVSLAGAKVKTRRVGVESRCGTALNGSMEIALLTATFALGLVVVAYEGYADRHGWAVGEWFRVKAALIISQVEKQSVGHPDERQGDFDKETAKATGKSKSTVRRDKSRGEAIPADVLARIQGLVGTWESPGPRSLHSTALGHGLIKG